MASGSLRVKIGVMSHDPELMTEAGTARLGRVPDAVSRAARVGWRPEATHASRHDSKGSLVYGFRRPLLRGFVWCTRYVYRRLARQVVRDIADYQRSGFEVVGVVGVGGSPSCGVAMTLDLKKSFEVVASCPFALMNREVMNEHAVLGCRTAGEGLFVRALRRELDRRGLTVPFFEHDLVAEMRGQPQNAFHLRAA